MVSGIGNKRSAAEAGLYLTNSGLAEQNPPNIKSRRLSDSISLENKRLVTMTSHSNEGLSGRKDDEAEGEWSIAESKSSRKKKRRKIGNEMGASNANTTEGDGRPSVRFLNGKGGQIQLKDLQDLVLYVLANGTAPTWLAVNESSQIQKVVVLMIPGLDRKSLEESEILKTQVTSSETDKPSTPEIPEVHPTPQDAPSALGQSTNGTLLPQNESLSANGSLATQHIASRLLENILSVRAPGDSYQNRVHSPLQAMLIAPYPKDKSSKDEKSFQAVRTPISKFIHAVDELQDAEYPVHPATFDNDRDAQLEHERREKTSQSASAGWVDTKVSRGDILNISSSTAESAQLLRAHDSLTKGYKVYAIDCEMVLTDDDKYSLARISVLDWAGKTVIDKFVKPSLPIKNYFTQFSGITPQILEKVTTKLEDIQQELLSLLTPESILLGHSLESDLNALKLTHPHIIDTSIIYPHPRGLPLRSSLKYLANKYLKREIQKGGVDGHDSVEDARAVLDLVRLKCEKGPRYGTLDANGESIFRRITVAERKNGSKKMRETAIVEYGTPERGLGKDATYKIACENDDDIIKGVLRAAYGDSQDLKGEESALRDTRKITSPAEKEEEAPAEYKQIPPPSSPLQDQIPTGGADFIWCRFRDLETARGWNTPPPPVPECPTPGDLKIPPTSPSPSPSSELDLTIVSTLTRLARLYESLPPKTLLIVYSGTGDMRPVLRLQQLQTQYRKEFKVKKWDQLSVKWTDVEEQMLRSAVDKARRGVGLVAVR